MLPHKSFVSASDSVRGNDMRSWAEDAEDLLVHGLLATTTPKTFLDVGANHPTANSVTYFLSLRGWTGVAVDPNPSFEPLWNAERPQDRFIRAGASSSAGHLDFHEFDPDVLSTFDSQRSRGQRPVEWCISVRSSTPVFMLGGLEFERDVVLEVEDGRVVHGEVAAV